MRHLSSREATELDELELPPFTALDREQDDGSTEYSVDQGEECALPEPEIEWSSAVTCASFRCPRRVQSGSTIVTDVLGELVGDEQPNVTERGDQMERQRNW